MQNRQEWSVFAVLVVLLAAGCTPSSPRATRVAPPPEKPIERYVQTQEMPIPRELPVVERLDEVDLVLVEVRLGVERGEELYRQGFLRNARDEFDRATDLLLETSSAHPGDARIQHELAQVTSRIHSLELGALRAGDGFTDQKYEPAEIDELANVVTFPVKIDPKVKVELEKEVEEVGHDLPIEITDRVLGMLEYYTGRRRGGVEFGLERMGRYRPMIEKILKEEGVPLDLIYLCQAESAFQPRALSRAKAKGMWQFISSRGREYGLRQTWWIDERSDPEKSTRAAARHLRDLYQEFGDWYLAMAAYNAGPVRVQRAIDRVGSRNYWDLLAKRALPKETMNYVPSILALTLIGKNPERYGFNIEPEQPLETERVALDKATDLRVIAEALELPVTELRTLNPHVLKWTTPPGDSEFELILPKGFSQQLTEKIASLPETKRVNWRYHTVRRGETLRAIARKYKTTIAELASANNLGKARTVRAGVDLIIPMGGSDAEPAEARPATARGNERTAVNHRVRRGDTLGAIAARYGVSVASIREWNGLRSNQITAGKMLRVSAPVQEQVRSAPAAADASAGASQGQRRIVHRVKRGETLQKIASTYRTTVSAIVSWNRQNRLSVIHPGDQITIYIEQE